MSRQTYYSKLWEDEENFPELSKWALGKEGEKIFSSKLCNCLWPNRLHPPLNK